MKKKVLIAVAVVLVLALVGIGAAVGYRTHYRNTHVFYEDAV